MPDAYTDNFDLILPEPGGSVDTWGDKLNQNFAQIDSLIEGRISSEATILDSSDDMYSLPSEACFYAVTGSAPANYPSGASSYSEILYITRNNGSNNAMLLIDSSNQFFWNASSAGNWQGWREVAGIEGDTISGFTRVSGSFGIGGSPSGTFDNGTAISLDDNDSGIRGNGDGRIELWANATETLRITKEMAEVLGDLTVSGNTSMDGDLEMNNRSITGVNSITINDDGKGEGFMLPSFGFVEDSGRAMIVAGSTEIASFYSSGSFRAYNTIYAEGDLQKGGKSVATEEMVNNKTDLANSSGDRITIASSGNLDHYVDGSYVFRVNSSGRLDRADGGIDPALLDNGLGAVGTYGYFQIGGNKGKKNPGDTVAGSDIKYAGSNYASTVSPSGTWRLMGAIANDDGNGTDSITLCLRIA